MSKRLFSTCVLALIVVCLAIVLFAAPLNFAPWTGLNLYSQQVFGKSFGSQTNDPPGHGKNPRRRNSPSVSAFTAGDLAVCRVGDGTAVLGNTATPVFIDEYAPDGTLVQSIPLPTTVSGSNQRLTASGNASNECQINRSTDGRYLLITGYNAAVGTASVQSSSTTTVPRVIGRIDASGNIDTTTTTTSFSVASPRSAISDNGSSLWAVGSNTGVIYTTLGGSGAGTLVSNTLTSIRSINIYKSQLYVSNNSTTTARLGAVGTGLPTTTGQTIVGISGFPTNSNTNQFFFADLDNSVPGVDTLYTADDGSGTGSTGGGIKKFSLVAGTWTYNGTFPANGVTIPATQFLGLTGSVNGSTVTLYGTRAGLLAKIVDSSGYNGTPVAAPTLIAAPAVPAAMGFRGISFTPVNTDLTISQSAPASVSVNTNYTYSLTVGNSGSTAASGVSVDFKIPTGTSFVSASGASNSVNSGIVHLTSISVAAGGTANLSVTVTAPATAQTVTSTGTDVVVDPANTILETNEANNTALDNTTIVSVPAAPNIAVSPTNLPYGDQIVNQTSINLSAAIFNNGNADLTYTATLMGADPGD
ncbi:MAG TPA: CARDB domain-containing protein, partial [Pyrinomonadaceae bacterium]|nr:CARDB domain-containing protein [Pyrinomonadaceae bacterium]